MYDQKRDKIIALCNKINAARQCKNLTMISEDEVASMIKAYAKEHGIKDFIEAHRKLSYEISQKILRKESV